MWSSAPDESGKLGQDSSCAGDSRAEAGREELKVGQVLREEAGAHRSKAGAGRGALCAHLGRRRSATRPSAAARRR